MTALLLWRPPSIATLRVRGHLHLGTAGMNWSLQRHLLQRRWLYLPAVAFRRPERRDAAPTATTENRRRASGDGRDRMLNSLFSSRPKTRPPAVQLQTHCKPDPKPERTTSARGSAFLLEGYKRGTDMGDLGLRIHS